MFKKTFQLLSVALMTSVLLVSSADASLIGAHVRFSDGPGNGNGGEFNMAIDYSPSGPFVADANTRTFCVELTEHISFGTTYKVGNLSFATVLSNKALTTKTAALFKAFAAGIGTNTVSTILGVSYDRANATNNNADARSLQLAIWKTMGWDTETIWGTGYGAEYAANTKAQSFVTAATNYANNNFTGDFYGVRVINLVGTNGTGNFQDQLTIVPEPGSIAIWGLMSLGVAGICNKRRRK